MYQLLRHEQQRWDSYHQDQNGSRSHSWIFGALILLESSDSLVHFPKTTHFVLILARFFHTLIKKQYTAYYDHTYHADQDSLTWTLDYDKTSDFDDVSGHWHLEAHPENPDCTRVFYACDIKLRGAIPKPVVNYLSKSALRTATGWVKKESEIQSRVAVEEESSSGSSSSSSSSSSSNVEEHEESPVSLTFTKDEIRALASGKPVKNLVTLNLNKGDMRTLNSKRQLTTQVVAKDGDA
jgi:hypothetical protein